ncbi:D-2-hydroxyacid dehydrogenase [Paludifilum halophilum]|uniref:Hydroxyacid dehydrogenase n=1 Tax=Paludifilum halophilum TaxID=1642702 RepID=A0A235B483_9BACL|nr:D-2-hydroxyacid dehydrogenase [Paludifilum halophilum]OYD07041.1 hydroxyacid dehydrogenase [Paludifilum halophilum]
MTHVISSAKMSEKHKKRLRERIPGARFSFFDRMEEALSEASSAEVLITYGEDLNEERLRRFSRLRWIQVISAGVERLPFAGLQERGIRVTNAKGIHETPMAEYALAVMLQVTRRVHELYVQQMHKNWSRDIRVGELAGKTVGIVGAGAVGRGIAERLRPFRVRILGLNSRGTPVSPFDEIFSGEALPHLLSRSDFVIVTVPLTPQTRGMIGETELERMKPGAWLINMARGAVVDESALEAALREKKIGGAVLDVFNREPLPPDHPFWTSDQVILTPHLSGRSPLYMTRAMDLFHRNLDVYLTGRGNMINPVSLEKGY